MNLHYPEVASRVFLWIKAWIGNGNEENTIFFSSVTTQKLHRIYTTETAHPHKVVADYGCSQSSLSQLMQRFKYFKSTARSSVPSGGWLWFTDTESEIKLLYLIDFCGSVLFSLSISLAVAALLGGEQKLLALAICEFADRNNKVAQSLVKSWWDSQQITFDCFELEPSV